MQIERAVAEYEYSLTRLLDVPDKSVIMDLTNMAHSDQHFANHIADILISRIIDVKNISYHL